MKTLILFAVVGCAAPTAPAHKPLAPLAVASPTPIAAMAVASARPERCSLRLTAQRVMVDGDLMSLEDAIVVCSNRSAVLVELADDADPQVWSQIDAALAAAKVPVLHRGERGHDLRSKPALIF